MRTPVSIRRLTALLLIASMGAIAVTVIVAAVMAGSEATKQQISDIALRCETATWPTVSRLTRYLASDPSSAEREVWEFMAVQYTRGPRGQNLPLAINRVAEWRSAERDTPEQLQQRVVTGWQPGNPGSADAAAAVQHFLLQNGRPALIESIHLPHGSRFVAYSEFTRHSGERLGWEMFSGANGNVAAFLSMSRVGFNMRGNCAVIYVEVSCGVLCGHGTYYVLHRTNAGWTIQADHLKWIA